MALTLMVGANSRARALVRTHQGGLAHGIGGLAGVGHHIAGDGGHDDDLAPFALQHAGNHRLAGVPGALHVDIQVGVPVLIALGEEVSQLADAGVGHQNIDGTKGGLGGLHPGLYTGGVGHVHTHRHGVLASWAASSSTAAPGRPESLWLHA